MISTFQELKNNRQDRFDQLTKKLNAMSKANTFYNESSDDRFWKLDVDKAGNGYAVIRFLPEPKGEDSPVVKLFSHAFHKPGDRSVWYIENSLTTPTKEKPEGSADPLSEYNSKRWAEGEKSEGRRFVSGDPTTKPATPGSKRKLGYYSNIYVVEDQAHPENNGKVFLFKYGPRIMDKIEEARNPKFPDVEAFIPFDLYNGANFKLKARFVEGQRNYNSSEWDLVEGEGGVKKPRGPLSTDDELLEKIWNSEYSLQEIIAPNRFKSYNELKARLAKVLGLDGSNYEVAVGEVDPWAATKAADVGELKDLLKEQRPPWEGDENKKVEEAEKLPEATPTEDFEENLNWFRKLADS
jgi:hypothetical protein